MSGSPLILSANDLDRLLSAVDQLPEAQNLSADSLFLAQLIVSERSKWGHLFSERKCVPGEVIYAEDDIGDSMCIILSGRVGVLKGEFSAPVILGCRNEGGAIGEMTLLDGSRRSASVVALEPVRLVEFSRDSFLELLRVSTTFSQGLMRLLSVKLREASEAIQKTTMEKIRDSLTELYNRRYMEITLDHELSRAARSDYPVSLILVDIDNFKNLNDVYGHQAGDQVLRSLGKLMRANVRRADIACRYGGEEFLIILPETSIETAYKRAEALRNSFAQLSVEYEGEVLRAKLSLGISAFPDHGSIPKQVIEAADAALYMAKKQGRNQTVIAGKIEAV